MAWRSFLPGLRCQRQFVELGAGVPPSGIMLVKECHEALAVGGLNEVHHFVNDDVFQKVLGLFHQFGIEAQVVCPVISASLLGFHPAARNLGSVSWLRMMVLRTLLMIPSATAFLDSFPF